MADGVLGGKGGNCEAAAEDEAEEEATVGLLGGSEEVAVLSAGFEGTEMFNIPGGGRFSDLGAVVVATTADAGVGVAGAVFLLLAAGIFGGLLGVTGGALGFAESKAGKSSDCNGFDDCDTMVFDNPVVVARAFTSCFAREDGVSATSFGVASGSDTLDRGVAVLGIKEELLDGVKGADVGTILEGGLIGASSTGGEG